LYQIPVDTEEKGGVDRDVDIRCPAINSGFQDFMKQFDRHDSDKLTNFSKL
jgi:hypothetical protein